MVTGRVLDGEGRPVRRQLVEIWQANAGGRYVHKRDQHPAALDPHFTGVGRCLTDDQGVYRFTTIKPGPYPWRNHRNAWRPAHIHFSLFGTEFTQRMVTQMYFPGDPLFALDPIYQSIVDPARPRAAGGDLRPRPDPARVEHRLPLGHRAHRLPPHPAGGRMTATPGQTVGPFFHYALPYAGDRDLVAPGTPGAVRLHGTVYDGAGAGVPDALVELWQADPQGRVVQQQGSLRRDGHTFTGFGRASTDRTGEYTFTTLVPGGVDAGAAVLRAHGLRARAAQPAVHPCLPAAGRRRPGRAARLRRRGPPLDVALRARRARLPLRRPADGRGGDRLPALSGTLTR